MTKVVYTALAVVLTGLGLSSCKKENTTNTNTTANANKGRLVCTADDVEWISDAPSKLHKITINDSFLSFTQEIYGTKAFVFGDTLYISGARVAGTDSSSLDFTVVLRPDRNGVYNIGNYPPMSAGTASACYYQKLGIKKLYSAYMDYSPTGTFEISGFSDSLKTFSGKFQFNMTPKNSGNPNTKAHSVKNGVFVDAKLD